MVSNFCFWLFVETETQYTALKSTFNALNEPWGRMVSVNLSMNYAWDSDLGSGVPGVRSFLTSQPITSNFPSTFNKKVLADALLLAAETQEHLAAATDPTDLFVDSETTFALLWRENATHRMKVVASSPPKLAENILDDIHSYLATTLNPETGRYHGDIWALDVTFLTYMFKNSDVFFLEESGFGKGEYQVLQYGQKTPNRSHLVQAFGKGEDQLSQDTLKTIWEAEKVSAERFDGLIHGKLASICHLFPDSPNLSEEQNAFLGPIVKTRYSQLKQNCFVFVKNMGCFLPMLHVTGADKEEAKRVSLVGRLNGQCNSTLYPFVGLELQNEGNVEILYENDFEGVGACGGRCALQGCFAWSVSIFNGKRQCRLCKESFCATQVQKCPDNTCLGMIPRKGKNSFWSEMGHAVALPRRTQVVGQPLARLEYNQELSEKGGCKIVKHWTKLASKDTTGLQKMELVQDMTRYDLRKIVTGLYGKEGKVFSFVSKSGSVPHPCKIQCLNHPLCDTVWLRLKLPFSDLGINGSGPLSRNTPFGEDYMRECDHMWNNGTGLTAQYICELYHSKDIVSVSAIPPGDAWLNVQEDIQNVKDSYLVDVEPTKHWGQRQKQKMLFFHDDDPIQ